MDCGSGIYLCINTKLIPMSRFIATLFLMLGLLFPNYSAMGCCSPDDPEGTDILITEGGELGGSPIHYAPALIPIQAAYYSSLSTIMVNFRFDLGSVFIEIENETTSEYDQTTVNATQGVHPFLISGTAGHWSISFTLSNGLRYEGEFDI